MRVCICTSECMPSDVRVCIVHVPSLHARTIILVCLHLIIYSCDESFISMMRETSYTWVRVCVCV